MKKFFNYTLGIVISLIGIVWVIFLCASVYFGIIHPQNPFPSQKTPVNQIAQVMVTKCTESYAPENWKDHCSEEAVEEALDMEKRRFYEEALPILNPTFGYPETGNFIVANLSDMTIATVDREREEIIFYPILSIRPSGKYATPTGTFKALTKEKNHFSSIGKVWMPWSVQFFENYYIHGWPYYPDGTDVAPGYSGGCIRLSTEDAEELYKFI